MPDTFDIAVRMRGLTLSAGAALLLLGGCAPPTGAPGRSVSSKTSGQILSIGGVQFGEGDIRGSSPGVNDGQGPVVTIEFTPAGEQKFGRVIREVGVGHAIPIRVGGKEVAAPILRDPDVTDRVTIAGLSTYEDAKTIAAAMGAGPR